MESSTERDAPPDSVESPRAQDHKHEMTESFAPLRPAQDGAAPLGDRAAPSADATPPLSAGATRSDDAAARPTDRAGVDLGRPLRKSQLQLALKDRVLFYLMTGAIHAFSLLPDFFLYPLGIAGGFIGYCLDRRHLVIGMKNLAIAFPERSEADRRRILRASYINLSRGGAEIIRLGGFFHQRLKRRVTYDRFAYWGEVAARYPGRGLIILSAHFGNFELLAPAHAMHGFQINLVHIRSA